MKIIAASAVLAAMTSTPAFAQRQGIGKSAPQMGTAVHSEGMRGHACVPTRHRSAYGRARRSQPRSAGPARRARCSYPRLHGEFEKVFRNFVGRYASPTAAVLCGWAWAAGVSAAVARKAATETRCCWRNG